METVTSSPEEILLRCGALFRAEQSQDLGGVIAEKLEDLRNYDILAMDRVVAILSWGRSGSVLLASYLDGHDDVMTLPELCGWKLYEFFDRFRSLSLREKLIAYPVYDPTYVRFFTGHFAISRAQYYAAVQAILQFYEQWPPEFLESRKAFFLFVHLAYHLALGKRRASAHPLIVHALHAWSDAGASYLVEDFSEAKFVHAVRDPISSCDGMFSFIFGPLAANFPRTYTRAPYDALCCLVNTDRPHHGMESRTRAIRFEDLHRDTDGTMHNLCDWLGIPYQPMLLNSTFNGNPWVVKRDGEAWSGPRMEQTQRNSKNLSRKDRALLFALFYENFVDWNYPCPKLFRHAIVRWIVFFSLFLVPTKMEIVAARATLKRRFLPSALQGDIWRAVLSLLGIAYCRMAIVLLVARGFGRRASGKALLALGPGSPSKRASRDDWNIDPAGELGKHGA